MNGLPVKFKDLAVSDLFLSPDVAHGAWCKKLDACHAHELHSMEDPTPVQVVTLEPEYDFYVAAIVRPSNFFRTNPVHGPN